MPAKTKTNLVNNIKIVFYGRLPTQDTGLYDYKHNITSRRQWVLKPSVPGKYSSCCKCLCIDVLWFVSSSCAKSCSLMQGVHSWVITISSLSVCQPDSEEQIININIASERGVSEERTPTVKCKSMWLPDPRETRLTWPAHLQIAFPSPQSPDQSKIYRKYTGDSRSYLSIYRSVRWQP